MTQYPIRHASMLAQGNATRADTPLSSDNCATHLCNFPKKLQISIDS